MRRSANFAAERNFKATSRPHEMILELCFIVSAMLGIYDCSYSVEITDLKTINEKFPSLDNVAGAFYPTEKLIQIADWTNFQHEWRHAHCYQYYYYHEKHNDPILCAAPHFKLQE